MFLRSSAKPALSLLIKAAACRVASQPDNEYVRCTTYDKDGNIVLFGKSLKKLDFMRKYDVAPRDLRKMIRSHTHQGPGMGGIHVDFVPLLLTHNNCIMLNFLNIRALIKCDSLVIFDYSLSSTSRLRELFSHNSFLTELSTRLKSTHPEAALLPYEFRALEAVLVDVTMNLSTEMNVHQTVVQNILASLETSVERTKLRYLLIQLKKLGQFHQKVKLINDLLYDLLNSNEQLNGLYLTEIKQSLGRLSHNHQEVELLLESYYATIDEIIQTVENLTSQIKTSEELIRFILDANRNELMLLGLKFSIGLLSFGITMYVAALYGMNLENFIEEKDGGFEAVVVFSSVSLVVLFLFCTKQLHKLQKLTMSHADKCLSIKAVRRQ
ncbi:hypothetical protein METBISCDRAFT_31080 [Metschnikowia bicuspidata]|uniref:Magnesium transporter n=1 Tax=Metschnikowia bicuspidata TaxID=27322 RepID=A0A4P9ZDL0_9ASCO|nr:hypothetical protein METBISCDRAFT_31080 [Metschnikowia bicuspidata]